MFAAQGDRGGVGSFDPNQQHWSQSVEVEQGGNVLVLHPRSKWASLGITPADVTVAEVGYYSMYGDVDHWQSLEPRTDRSLMRKVAREFCQDPQEAPLRVDFDLNDGYANAALDGILFKQQIPVLMEWARQNAEDPELRAIKDQIDIVSTCSTLANLMQALYDNTAGNLIFGAARVNGKVVVGSLIRPDIHGVTEGASNSRTGSGSRQGRAKFWGRRFEVYMTADDEGVENLDGGNGKVAAPRFRTVVHAKLSELNLLLAAGVDATNLSGNDHYPKKYVDFATVTRKGFESSNYTYRGHMLRWWTNNVLNGTGTLFAGVHNNGHVMEVKQYSIDMLPAIVKAKEESAGTWLWDPDVCLGFLHALLKFVLNKVVKPHVNVVYEFRCDKEIGAFTSREVPTDIADGHDYLQGDAVQNFLA
ncbi:hypothetical protein BV898_10861 [Hypsibius exemplaris]|uniref:Decapping nuclease n=1 Tax=Hypsibius exemplaris TaxID=2072580 RepID=A0A1W0WIE9_HYPEX|nr:hypothetical protein BV898_10861 [Hypsibius exemplaris]